MERSENPEAEGAGDVALTTIDGQERQGRLNSRSKKKSTGEMPEIGTLEVTRTKDEVDLLSQTARWDNPAKPCENILDSPTISSTGQRRSQLRLDERR